MDTSKSRVKWLWYAAVLALCWAGILAPGSAAPKQPAAAGSVTCLADIPAEAAASQAALSLLRVSADAQLLLMRWLLQRDDATGQAQAQAETVAAQAALGSCLAAVQAPLGKGTAEAGSARARCAEADAAVAALAVVERQGLPWAELLPLLEQVLALDTAALCEGLAIRAPTECGRGTDQHNLFVTYLRNVRQLCDRRAEWQPSPLAHPRIKELAALTAAEPYFAPLERYLEQASRNESFQRRQQIYTLIYLDYLERAFTNRQARMVFNEFLVRRRDLLEDQPGFAAVKRQLSRLLDNKMIE